MPPAEITDLQYTLLGLLAFQPMSGYDIKRAFADSPLSRYSPSSGAIYPALARLEKLALVCGAVEHTHELRPRKLYAATPAGLLALDAWLSRPVDRALVEHDMSQVLLRFALMEARLTRAQVVAFLESVAAALASYLADLQAYEAVDRPTFGRHQRLAIAYGLASVRTQLAWANATLADIQAAE